MSHSMNKRLASIAMIFILAFAAVLPAQPKQADAADNISIYVNGSYLSASNQATIINGNTMVPLRSIFEALGAQVEWDGTNQVVAAYDPTTDNIVTLRVNQYEMAVYTYSEWLPYESNPTSPAAKEFVQEHMQKISTPPLIQNGRTLVPLRAISTALGCDVEWYGNTRTVTINR